MRRLNSEFVTRYISEAGNRAINKDYFGFVEMDNFACWAIAESYDNDNNLISGQLAVETVINAFTKKPTFSKRKLKSYIKQANHQLRLQSGNFRLKASILIVVTDYVKFRYVSCGNCRLNAFRGSNVMIKSADTSLYQEMIDSGKAPEDGSKGLEESRNLYSHLGKRGKLQIKTSKKLRLQNDDVFLMTTWGFWEKVTTVEMLDALDGTKDAMEYAEELQDLFLSKQGRTVHNYTIAAIFVNKIYQGRDNKRKIIKIAIIVTVILLIIAIIIFIFVHNANKKRKYIVTTVNQYETKGDMYIDDENYERALNEYDLGLTEIKNLKGTFGKKGKENQKIKENMTLKQRVTQLILDADELFEQKEYEKAKTGYEKALKEAKTDMDFYEKVDTVNLESKMLLCDTYIYIDLLVSLGDTQAELKDYENASKSYEEAKQLAVDNKNKEALQEINLKIGEMQTDIKEEQDAQKAAEEEKQQEEKDKKQKNGELIELDGDTAVTNEDYELALDYYNQALEAYKEIEEIDKASAVQKKITDTLNIIKQQENDILTAEADTYVQIADSQVTENKYEEAVENYKRAKEIYAQVKLTDKVTEVAEKISTTQSNKKENEIAQQKIAISEIESRGDRSLMNGDYLGAIDYYKQARTLYQGINDMDKVLSIEEKIKGVEDIQKTNTEKLEELEQENSNQLKESEQENSNHLRQDKDNQNANSTSTLD